MEKLKRLREASGLSQVKLAARADLNPATVNQIERGMRDASPGTLRKLADALGVSLYELMEEEAPKVLTPPPLELEEQRGASEVSRDDLANLCRDIEAEIQRVRETPAEDLKTQTIADRRADLYEAQAALSTAINREGPATLSDWNMRQIMRERRRARQGDEDAASETG